jgi:sugar (pentulose or hexulose) kinase
MISVADTVVTDLMVRHVRKRLGNACCRRGEGVHSDDGNHSGHSGEWRTELCECARCLRPILSRRKASVAESVVGIDKRGHPTGPIIAWLDQRTVSEAEWLRSRISEEEVFAITGSPIDATFSLCKLLWLQRQRPEQFNAAVHWLLVADWIAFSLTGEMAASASLASRTLAFDISKLEWSDKILQAAGLDHTTFVVPKGPGPKGHESIVQASAWVGSLALALKGR